MNSDKAVIYDMDGIIIDSEPLWREAEIITFGKVGLDFTEDMCRETMGMRLIEVVEYWYEKTPWNGASLHEVEKMLLDKVTNLIIEKGEALPGVEESLAYFKTKGFKIALASSSASSLIVTVLKKLNIKEHFELANSAEHLTYGKPHPEIFIKTSEQLGVKPMNCWVIEDSFHGVLAAKAALMKVIAVPDNENKGDKRYAIADYELNSLNDILSLPIE